jgi:ribonuclease D
VALVSEPAEVAAIAEALRRAPLVAFDLEFLSQDRLIPTLCLLQVSWLDSLDAPVGQIVAAKPEVRLVDPFAADVTSIIEALTQHPLVVAHAPRQDLGLLASRYGTRAMPGLIDTQLMAAFCGVGDQVGLATLANELLGTSLAKDQQWTAWEKRPLTDAQLTYAAADVRYLPAIYALLSDRLGPRLAWAREESAQILVEALAATDVTPETAWQHVGGARGLDAASQSALVALAAWRQRTAVELDRPLGQVVNDKALVELAKFRPDASGGVRSIKGMSPIAKTRATEIVETIEKAPPAAAPSRPGWRAASSRAQRWSEMLLAIVSVIAEETSVAGRLLGTRSDAEEFARIVDEQGLDAASKLPALATWRREVLGKAWRGWLAGEVALVGDVTAPLGMRLVEKS